MLWFLPLVSKENNIDIPYLVHTPYIMPGIMVHIENANRDFLSNGFESSDDVYSSFQVSCCFTGIYHRLGSSKDGGI